MNILHIHQDYPDGRPYPFTKAVANLIAACQVHDGKDTHQVISINRTSNPFKVSVKTFAQGISFVYWAIPLPWLYYLLMKVSAYLVYRKIQHLPFDVIHAHKLTSEGVLAYFLSKKLNIPYVLSIRGGSDIHNIKRLGVHKKFFAKVYHNAEQVFWVSAWAKKSLANLLALNESEVSLTPLLPNICNIHLAFPHIGAEQRKNYLTAISFHQYKRKSIPQLIQAIAMLKKQGCAIQVDIYGAGKSHYKIEIEQLIKHYQVQAEVQLKGQVSQIELLAAMSQSKGFLMPAVNETFGMAYLEALSVGCPILYVANTGIDGYFNDESIGARITAVTPENLLQAITAINDNNADLCQALQAKQNAQGLLRFTAAHIAEHYLDEIKQINQITPIRQAHYA